MRLQDVILKQLLDNIHYDHYDAEGQKILRELPWREVEDPEERRDYDLYDEQLENPLDPNQFRIWESEIVNGYQATVVIFEDGTYEVHDVQVGEAEVGNWHILF